MIIKTNFNVGDVVWDTLTNKKVKIIGFSINRGKNCCQSENNQDIYFVDNHMCGTFRKPEELIKEGYNNENDENLVDGCCGGDCNCNAC